MKNLQDRLNFLIEKEKKFSYIKDASFHDENDFKRFYNDHRNDFEELKNIKKEIRDIQWQIKTPTERRKSRADAIALLLKFIDEGENMSNYNYECLYLQLLDTIQKEILMEHKSKEELKIIYQYLDSKQFVYPIKEEIYEKMNRVKEISLFGNELKCIVVKNNSLQ